jgi:CopG family nickel-responsive transcriptional regulator
MTVSLDEELVAQFQRHLERHGYRNRSEAIRDLIREKLEAERLERAQAPYCTGTLTYVYNHGERELARRLTHTQHDHHDVSVSTLHVHLDHDHCLETVVVSGPTDKVRGFADAIITQPGVRHGRLYLIPVEVRNEQHTHGSSSQRHTHANPQT